jgi:AcrR family transcriptional regulator
MYDTGTPYDTQHWNRQTGRSAVVDDNDEFPWPRFRREAARRHRERGTAPRGRDRGLSRDEIVSVAIAVADAEGPDAISMRRIAKELHAGAMSLYWHVTSKEELIDLMLEQLEAETAVPEPTGDWRSDLRELAHRQRAGLLRHPWVMEFAASRPPSGPNDARNLELMLGMLSGLDLDARMTVDILMTVVTYVLGAVLREVQEMRSDRERREMEAELPAAEIAAARDRFHEWIASADRYPNILRMIKENVDPDAAATRDERFEFGLGCVLDGIAARIRATD